MPSNYINSIEFVNAMLQEGYEFIANVPGRGVCAIHRMLYTTGLFYNLDYSGYRGRYCFHTKAEAVDALKNWNGKDDPPGDWIKHKGDYEYANPKLSAIINSHLLEISLLDRARMIDAANIYKKLNIKFHIAEVSEFHIRIVTEQGQCARSVNYNIPELVRFTKEVFDPIRNGRRLVIAPKPYEPNQQSSKPI